MLKLLRPNHLVHVYFGVKALRYGKEQGKCFGIVLQTNKRRLEGRQRHGH